MNNDENDMALNDQVGEEANLDTTPVAEQEASGDIGESQVEQASGTETQSVETDGENKRSAKARISELTQKARSAEERAQSLEAKIAELTGSVNPMPDFTQQGYQQTPFNPQEAIIADGEEVTVAELNRRIAERDKKLLQTANAQAQLMQKQSEAISRINRETSDVVRKYPELDPDSEHYNPKLSARVSKTVEKLAKANPYTVSVKEEVDEIMSLYKEGVTQEVGQATENIAKQVSQAALRPTSVRKPEKTAAEKSIAELEAELGIVYS